MMSPRTPSTFAAAVAGLGLLTLAGCAVDGDSPVGETADPVPSTEPSTQPTSAAPSGPSVYADGTYVADGSYVAPSGPETISVSITLVDDLVTEVSVVGDAVDHSAFEFQRRFAKGIAAEVVGRDIADLSVSRISGSSLTSIGFNAAVETIRSEALV